MDDDGGSNSNARKSRVSRKKSRQPTVMPSPKLDQQHRPLLTVQSSLPNVPEATYRSSKLLPMLEKGFVFRSKGSQECFYVAEQISLVSYTAIKDQSMAKHYVRIEAMDSTGAPKQLKREVLVLQEAAAKAMSDNRKHFLKLESRGRIVDRNLNFVIVPFCERNLALSTGHRLTHPDAIRLSIQCFQAIHDLHALGYVHRNLKPNVFCLRGLDTTEVKLYLTSFWYSYRFRKRDGVENRSPKSLFKMKKSKFLPRSYHLGKEITRKDDLESWIYIAVCLIEPSALGWTNTMPDMSMLSMKERFFCVDSDSEPFTLLPKDLHAIVKYLQKLDDRPNYPFIGMLLAEMIKREKIPFDGPFDFQSGKFAEAKPASQSVAKKKKKNHPKKDRTKEQQTSQGVPENAPKPFVGSNQVDEDEDPPEAPPQPPVAKNMTQQKKRRPKQQKSPPPPPENDDPFEGEPVGVGEQAPDGTSTLSPVTPPAKHKKKAAKHADDEDEDEGPQENPVPVTSQAKKKKAPKRVEEEDEAAPQDNLVPVTPQPKPKKKAAKRQMEEDEAAPQEKAPQQRTNRGGEENEKSASERKESGVPPPAVFSASKVPKPKGEDPKEEL